MSINQSLLKSVYKPITIEKTGEPKPNLAWVCLLTAWPKLAYGMVIRRGNKVCNDTRQQGIVGRGPRSGELRTQKLKSHLVRTQSLNVRRLKPGGQYIAIHATLTARDFFLANFYPSGPCTCIFSKTSPASPVLAVANTYFLCRPAK